MSASEQKVLKPAELQLVPLSVLYSKSATGAVVLAVSVKASLLSQVPLLMAGATV